MAWSANCNGKQGGCGVVVRYIDQGGLLVILAVFHSPIEHVFPEHHPSRLHASPNYQLEQARYSAAYTRHALVTEARRCLGLESNAG
jgi:hypothetical protein